MARLTNGWITLPGTSKRRQNTNTGEIVSDWFYKTNIKRPGVNNRELAKINRLVDPIKQAARPARGRSSVLKENAETQKTIAQARIEFAKQKEVRIKSEKDKAKRDAKVEKLLEKQLVVVKKVTKGLLKPGHKGRRLPFNDYSDYLAMRSQAQATGVIFSYGLGVEGIDLNTDPPSLKSITVFTQHSVRELISEESFNSRMLDVIESKASYFMFLHYYIHLAYSKEYYEKRAIDKKPKTKTTKILRSKNNKKR